MTKGSLSVVIPVYNEEKLLREVVTKIILTLKKFCQNFEIILVENGSSDNSIKIADDLAHENKRIRIFHLPYASYGEALRLGYLSADKEFVANFSADWVDLMFLKKALLLMEKYDLILASKNIEKSKDERSFLRHLGSKVYHQLVKLLFAVPVSDTHGIKVFKREKLIDTIKKCSDESETFDTELVIRAYRNGLAIAELPIQIKDKRPSRVKILHRGMAGLFQLIRLRLSL